MGHLVAMSIVKQLQYRMGLLELEIGAFLGVEVLKALKSQSLLNTLVQGHSMVATILKRLQYQAK